jgi:hypothetical protein
LVGQLQNRLPVAPVRMSQLEVETKLEMLTELSPGLLLQLELELELELELNLMPVLALELVLVLVLLVSVPVSVPESVPQATPMRSRSMVALTLEPTPCPARRSPAPRRPPDVRKRHHRPSLHPT